MTKDKKTTIATCKQKDCKKEYDKKEVARILGEESMPAILGYCSAHCYTKHIISG